MKRTTILYAYQLVTILALMAALASCKKTDPNAGLAAPRLFMPSKISVNTGETTAKVTWEAPLLSEGLPLTYTAEFSQDSAFATSEFSLNSDSLTVTATDDKLQIRKKYFVRVKANAYEDQPESKWMVSSGFSISGEQLYLPIRDLEIKETAITLRWKITAGLTSITLTPQAGNAVSYPISAGEASAGVKTIPGINPGTSYTAELFMGTKSKGYLQFTTQPVTVYSTVLNPGDDVAAAITAAANNAIIGLNPGAYNTTNTGFTLLNKTVTLKSTSGNPSDTKVNFKEFTLRGTGAGINLSGIELDGTPGAALYFINLTGVAADAELCTFTQVTVDNCIVHGAATSFLRANRGANGGDYKMSQVVVKNSLVYDVATNLSYMCFHLDKLELGSLIVTKSTFYNFGQSLIACSATLTSTPATMTFDYCTLNNFGAQSKYVIMDANANPVKLNVTNSIIANVPRPAGIVQNAAIRATAATSFVVFSNNNVFNFNNATGTALTLPTSNTTQIGNQAINLGWSTSTTDFTLPAGSVLRTVSNVGTAIGDPRWTY